MRVFSSFLAYANKVRPFIQPALSANGTIGGDSFAVCGRRLHTGLENLIIDDAYKLTDGKAGTSIAVRDVYYTEISYGIYNPNPIRMNAEPTISTNMDIAQTEWYGTNDKAVFDAAIETWGSGEMELVLFNKPRKYYKYYKIGFASNEPTAKIFEIELHCSEKIKGA